MPVVDASIVVDWVAPRTPSDSAAMRALRTLATQRAELVAPRLLLEEVANALLTGLRRRRWTGAEADEAFVRTRTLPVRLVDSAADVESAYDLARRYDEHPIYDMLYVAVAQRMRTTLITADERLRSRLVALPWVIGPEQV
jgi:predicted nucleic acid-binding protein